MYRFSGLLPPTPLSGDASSADSTPKGPSTWTQRKQALGVGILGLLGALYVSPKDREECVTYNGVLLAYDWYCFRKAKARASDVHVPESKRK